MSSTREAYGAALTELAEKYEFFVFDADLSKATQTIHFAKKYPDRFTDMGIAECNMMGYAAGYAASGAVVFASTFAAFAAGRAYDQIRNSIAYPNLNVKIAATHGGVLIGADGGSHQCVEDLALMRAVPNMTILYPADTIETKNAWRRQSTIRDLFISDLAGWILRKYTLKKKIAGQASGKERCCVRDRI